MKTLSEIVRSAASVLAMPIATYPGTMLTGTRVRDLVTDPDKQSATHLAFHRRFHTPVLMTCMDLSIEAEAFGTQVEYSDNEVPTVRGRVLDGEAAVHSLRIPRVGTKRTHVTLGTVRALVRQGGSVPVLAGMIGPFSLAGRLFDINELIIATVTGGEVLIPLLEKVTLFLQDYAGALKAEGAAGVIIAEPTAGLLSPAGLERYSSPFVKRIIDTMEDGSFEVILHNCGARNVHLSAIAASGAHILHFGSPMDIAAARAELPAGITVCGNLDPVGVFSQPSPEFVSRQTRELMASLAQETNVVISSGCDLPASTPLTNLEAFFREVVSGVESG